MQVDQKQLGVSSLALDQKIAGVQIAVNQTVQMKPRCDLAELFRDLPAGSSLLIGRKGWKRLQHELIQRLGGGDFPAEEEAVERDTEAFLFADGDCLERRQTDVSGFFGGVIFQVGFARPDHVQEQRLPIGDAVMLQIKPPLGSIEPIDRPMRSGLDDHRCAVFEPGFDGQFPIGTEPICETALYLPIQTAPADLSPKSGPVWGIFTEN